RHGQPPGPLQAQGRGRPGVNDPGEPGAGGGERGDILLRGRLLVGYRAVGRSRCLGSSRARPALSSQQVSKWPRLCWPDEMPDPNEAQNLDVSEQGAQAYFVRESATRFGATQLLSGAWNTEEQHIAPTIGLLAHLLETDFAARRQDDLRLTRVSYDILGT